MPSNLANPTSDPKSVTLGAEDVRAVLDHCVAIRQSLDDLLHEVDSEDMDGALAVRLLKSVRSIEILLGASSLEASGDGQVMP